MTSFDTIIIGGGHNGLVAAGFLAKGGHRVLLLEAGSAVGGGAQTRNFATGHGTSGLAHLVNRLDPAVTEGLKLDQALYLGEPIATVLPHPELPAIVLRGAYGETLEGVSPAEAKAFLKLRDTLLFHAAVLRRFLKRNPPRPGAISFADMTQLGLAGLGIMRRGREDARDFARMLLMNVADIAEEYLGDDRLKGLISFDATLGIHLGPRSPTSLLGLYYRLTGESHGLTGGQYMPKGGMGSVARALQQAATRLGVTIRTDCPVSEILTENDAAVGVKTASGETIMAKVIVSAIHPVTTLKGLLQPGLIDTGLARCLTHVRTKGDAAKLHLALDRVPQFSGVKPEDHKSRIVIAPSLHHVERAFNPAKYGEFSSDPVMEITLPSLNDPTLAPNGGCTLSAVVQYAPYELKQGWDAGKPKFLAAIMASLERHAPGIGACVKASELLVPTDIEREFRMPGGHWHHGELQVDQLFINRPTFAVSHYQTPVNGLYLASAGSHPGGGISGLPGMNAARHILSGRK